MSLNEDVKKYLVECLGTFIMVFFGTGAIILNDVNMLPIGNLGIALAFGLSVTLVIHILGSMSGAHINPAVSLAFSLTEAFEKRLFTGYVIAQVLGAICASSILHTLFPTHNTLGATLPHAGVLSTFAIELVLTFILMLVILLISQNKKMYTYTAFVVGLTVGLEAYFAGGLTGASMNPARSIGPALLTGQFSTLWIYIIAPLIGGIFASYVWRYITLKVY